MIYSCDNRSINRAVSILKNGGIIICPTDTLYGFGVDATNSSAINKLNILKQRVQTYSVIVKSVNMINDYAKISLEQKSILNDIE